MDSPLGLLAAGLSAVANKTIEFTDHGGANAVALHRETMTCGKLHRDNARPAFQSVTAVPHYSGVRAPMMEQGLPSTRSGRVGDSLHAQSIARSRKSASRKDLQARLDIPEGDLPEIRPKLRILIKLKLDKRLPLEVDSDFTVSRIKQEIRSKIGLQSDDYHLLHHLTSLEDDNTLESYEIKDGDQIDLIPKKKAPETVFAVSKDTLAPRFDFDFTKIRPPLWNSYKRGGKTYRRPYGWKRYALKVVGVFDDDDWLGGQGPRLKSSSGEWPVSYHGTSKRNAESIIADTGYLLSKGQRFKFGEGIYSTPDIRIAERYATEFEHGGKKYLIVLQNRVNPLTLKKIKKADKVGTGEYWLNPEQSDVRPYGILIKEKKYSWLSVP